MAMECGMIAPNNGVVAYMNLSVSRKTDNTPLPFQIRIRTGDAFHVKKALLKGVTQLILVSKRRSR